MNTEKVSYFDRLSSGDKMSPTQMSMWVCPTHKTEFEDLWCDGELTCWRCHEEAAKKNRFYLVTDIPF